MAGIHCENVHLSFCNNNMKFDFTENILNDLAFNWTPLFFNKIPCSKKFC